MPELSAPPELFSSYAARFLSFDDMPADQSCLPRNRVITAELLNDTIRSRFRTIVSELSYIPRSSHVSGRHAFITIIGIDSQEFVLMTAVLRESRFSLENLVEIGD